MYNYYQSLYLEHHGIKGQKWGVRRFQNEDGTRTSAGKSRYSKGSIGGGIKKIGKSIKNMSPRQKALAVGAALATVSLVQSRNNAKAAAAFLSEMDLKINMSEVIGKSAVAAGKAFALGAGATMLAEGAKTTWAATKPNKKHGGAVSKAYLNSFDKADKNLDRRIANNQHEKKRAEKLTKNISDGSRLKNAYLNSFDSYDKRLKERKANNQYEKKRAEKLVDIVNKKRKPGRI